MWWIIAGLVFVAFFFAGCTCCRVCIYFFDSFGRADSTNLGSDWTEVSGDWSIASNRLISSDANAIAISTTDIGTEGGTVSSQLDFVSSEYTDRVFRLIGAYTDTDNYVFAEISVSQVLFEPREGYIKLYDRVGGVNTLLEEYTGEIPSGNTNQFDIELCWAEGRVLFQTNNPGGSSAIYLNGYSTNNGGLGGVGYGASGTTGGSFKAVTVYRRLVPSLSNCKKCANCIDSCTDELPATIEVTLPSDWLNVTGTYGCSVCESTFNGQTFILDKLQDTGTQMKVDPFSSDLSKITNYCGLLTRTAYALSCVYHYSLGVYCTKFIDGQNRDFSAEIFAWFERPHNADTRRLRVKILSTGYSSAWDVNYASDTESFGECAGAEWELDLLSTCGDIDDTGFSTKNCSFTSGTPGAVTAVAA